MDMVILSLLFCIDALGNRAWLPHRQSREAKSHDKLQLRSRLAFALSAAFAAFQWTVIIDRQAMTCRPAVADDSALMQLSVGILRLAQAKVQRADWQTISLTWNMGTFNLPSLLPMISTP
ncbi:hypothetical protein BDV10DRAFT_160235 [Aspergillus recurvatus]